MTTLLPRLLATAASRRNAAAIVTQGETSLTYADLFGRAAALATRLTASGCGAESIVALELPLSAEHVIGVLGIWLAGAAFAPVDVRYPAERRRHVLELLRPARVLTAPELALSASEDVVDPDTAADRLAYVICSSGTTGKPKAVAVTHRGLPAVIDAQIATFGLSTASRVLWTLSPAFDASISDLMTTLCAGATLYIEPPEALVPGVTLETTLEARGITHWDVPPALLRRMDADALPRCVENLVIGGEVTPPEVVRAFARRCRVVNVYGPTEASICTSMVPCDAETWSLPLIGMPVPGVQYRVQDDNELLIGGPTLARGYLGDPQLTAQRFVTLEGERWYRSGDRVKPHASGSLEFAGRIDRQLKVQGVLVEPEEIETCLTRFPGVERAAVLALQVGDGLALVAFVAPRVGIAELMAHLASTLPKSHVPARIEALEALPVGSAGKIDYEALRQLPLDPARGGVDGGVLGGLWAHVLRVPAVGLDDDVWALGATSLDVLTVTAKAHAAGLVLSPEVLAAGRTVRAQLAPAAEGMAAAWLTDDVARVSAATPAHHASSPGSGDRVFVTGGTGFVGSRLVIELLDADRDVVCLVRAADPDSAMKRLREAAQRHGRELAESSRLTVVCGDLRRDGMALGTTRWAELAATVSDVVHCGAEVNMLASYAALRDANVLGTRRALDLCRSGVPKRLLHVSTLSVLAAADHDDPATHFDEAFALERTQQVFGGYAQSKWAAERLLMHATRDDVRCVRLGQVTGDSHTGYAPRRDLLAMVVRDLHRLESLPRGLPMALRTGAMPVDYAAKALAALVRHPGKAATYHLTSDAGMTLAMLRSALAELGHTLADVDRDVWFATAAPTVATAAISHALDRERFAAYRALDPFDASHLSFETSAMAEVLAAAGVAACAAPTPDRVRAFVRYAVRP